jgi:hypothetical protein
MRTAAARQQSYLPGFPPKDMAATTLLAAGLLVSTFDLVDLLLVVGTAFLLPSDFFSIAIMVSPDSI